MKNWIISGSELINKYFIITEKSIWISDQKEGANIDELIGTTNLGKVRSIRYEDLKEIVFIDSDSIIELNYNNDRVADEEFQIDTKVYEEIKSYLKKHLKGTELTNYSVINQIIPQLTVLGISIVFIVVAYIAALEMEKGKSISISGRSTWFKNIFVSIAEIFGTTGTLIVALVLISILAYFINEKIQNPKKGEILKIAKLPKLVS